MVAATGRGADRLAGSPRFARPTRVVVKVGSSSLRNPVGHLDRNMVGRLVDQLAAARREGVEVVLVSSGAVAAGLAPLGFAARPADLPGLQAAASVGQGLLVHTYQDRFADHGIACGQVLLTPEDVVHRGRYLNARHTFDRLLGLGAVPVVNENDTVVTDELRFGDNDRLAALVASMLGAQLLVLLSDVEGLLDGDPSVDPDLPVIDRVDDLDRFAGVRWGGSSSEVGTGGMASKIEGVRIARFSAAHSVIANARRDNVVADVIAGEHVGTWFPPSPRRPESRKLWIAFAPQPQGALTVDAGAVRALTERGSSLLAAGVVDAVGAFGAGDAVDVRGPDGRTIARGLVAYDAQEVLRICGRSTEQIVEELGSGYAGAVIHRDRLVVVA
jgi:glutamate 5-kinase